MELLKILQRLKMNCLKKGVIFNSQTDTEVIVNLVEEKISKEKCPPLEAVRLTIERLRGSFALCFIFRGLENLLITTRRGSPLAIGFGENEKFCKFRCVIFIIIFKENMLFGRR